MKSLILLMRYVIILIIIAISITLAQYHPYESSPFGFHPAKVTSFGYPNIGYFDAEYIGIHWTREAVYAFWFFVQPELFDTTLDFSFYDNQYSVIPDSICILGNIAPQGGRDEGRCLDSSWLPVDSVQYVRFVLRTIERYDGDGFADMPGLTNPIKYWQVGNEPDGSERLHFARLQKMTYHAIKEADSTAQVLIGGCTGFPYGYIYAYNRRFAPFVEELAGCCFDIFDMHWYGEANGEYNLMDTESREDALAYICDHLIANGYSPDLPIWITEMGTYSGDPLPMGPHYDPLFQSEAQQAADLFKRYVYPLSKGVKKVFMAFGLIEGFMYDGGYFDFTGLIYDGWGPYDQGLGAKKLGYYTYKKMTELLGNCSWETVDDLSIPDSHVFICKVERVSAPVAIAWWDYYRDPHYSVGDSLLIFIPLMEADSLVINNVVPHCSLGIEILDYETAFEMDTIVVIRDTLKLRLGKDPVILELLNPVAIMEKRNDLFPKNFALLVCPNPFNESTTIMLDFGSSAKAQLHHEDLIGIKIYDINGRLVCSPFTITLFGMFPELSSTELFESGETQEDSDNFLTPKMWGKLSRESGTKGKEFVWTPESFLPSGIYFIRAEMVNKCITTRVVYLR
ncbi:hypothetical protein JW877_00820 [bacterium]|nr:hypothetical protein [bacterium]